MTQDQYDPDYAGPFFTEQQLAQRWGKHTSTLARYRKHGTGPVFYKLHDVLAYELANSIFPDLHNNV
jgi:hypothetical protein